MSSKKNIVRHLTKVWSPLFCAIAALWAVELVDALVFSGRLDLGGIRPREIAGLRGVLFAPMLHGGFAHLAGNTVAILLFGGVLACYGRRELVLVTASGWLLGGAGVWLLGRPSVHIGASGVVFAFFGYLLLRGWYERKPVSMILSALLLWAYGGMLWGMVPVVAGAGISWEGHLFGFLAGVAVSAALHRGSASAKAQDNVLARS